MIELTDQNFEEVVIKNHKPVLVDFFAHWCFPCSVLTPILEKLAAGLEDKILFVKANLDNIPATAQKFGIDRIPTVIIFKEGRPVNEFVGFQPEPVIKEWLENTLKEEERIEKEIKEYEDCAKKDGFLLNSNKEAVKTIIRGLLENEKKYGARYCPCRRISGNPDEDKVKICPCQFRGQEIERQGRCLCGLFVK